ncbi:MAG: hypothetical protein ACW98D_14015 [Promethearchaeota archaeon]|jgi:hypothetical protein
MSSIAGLSPEIIEAITRNLPVSDETRQELVNFLSGRVTTVTNEEEFSSSLKTLTKDIEAGSNAEEGSVVGEVVGALEGGAVVGIAGGVIIGKGLEILGEISKLGDLLTGTRAENDSRQKAKDRATMDRGRGLIHGAMGRSAETVQDLLKQAKEAKDRSDRKKNIVPTEAGKARDFRLSDPKIRKRGRGKPVTDDFGDGGERKEKTGGDIEMGDMGNIDPLSDVELDPEDIDLEDPQSKQRRPRDRTPERFPPIPPFIPIQVEEKKRKKESTKGPIDQPFEERTNPGGGESSVTSYGDLRPEFKMLGAEFFNKNDLKLINSEWVDFDFVEKIDMQNKIEIENSLADKIRFNEPLFLPDFQAPLEPPSRISIYLKRIPMKREIQLTQRFENKFDSADMGNKINLTETYNHSVFDYNFKNLKLYNPI